jgi:hypothetical protein
MHRTTIGAVVDQREVGRMIIPMKTATNNIDMNVQMIEIDTEETHTMEGAIIMKAKVVVAFEVVVVVDLGAEVVVASEVVVVVDDATRHICFTSKYDKIIAKHLLIGKVEDVRV